MSQINGVVRWFSNAKGYGFLGTDGGADAFVHFTAIQKEGYRSLKEGDRSLTRSPMDQAANCKPMMFAGSAELSAVR